MHVSLKNRIVLLTICLLSSTEALKASKKIAFITASTLTAAAGCYMYYKISFYNQLKAELFNAIACKDIDSIKTVLSQGLTADIKRDKNGKQESALTYALHNNCQQNIIELLLNNGAQVTEQDTKIYIFNHQIKSIINLAYFNQLWKSRFNRLKIGAGLVALTVLGLYLQES